MYISTSITYTYTRSETRVMYFCIARYPYTNMKTKRMQFNVWTTMVNYIEIVKWRQTFMHGRKVTFCKNHTCAWMVQLAFINIRILVLVDLDKFNKWYQITLRLSFEKKHPSIYTYCKSSKQFQIVYFQSLKIHKTSIYSWIL